MPHLLSGPSRMPAPLAAAMLGRTKEVDMPIVKTMRFPAHAEWEESRLVELSALEKPPLVLATPPEFKDGIAGFWSPEELLVGAVAACYELTLAAIAERLDARLEHIAVDAAGHVEHGREGYEFTVVELDVTLEVEPEHETRARRAAELAEDYCVVARALEVPVHVRVAVVVREPAAVAP
jgi:organic hydroperoxide reductase OsmC/OhrA